MTITKTGERVEFLRAQKERATAGCDICPHCGTQQTGLFAQKTQVKGLIKIKYMRQDCHVCRNCGCEWESDPYEY